MHNLIGKQSLQVVMTAPFVLIIVAAVGLTGYLAFRNGQNAVNDLARQLQHEATARIQQHLDAYLATPLLINQLNLDGIRLGQLDLHNQASLERHFLTQIERFDSVVSLAYASEQREYVGTYRRVLGVDLGTAIASEKTGYSLEAYKVTPQGGRELVDSLPDYDPRARPWYQAAVQAGQQTWTPIFVWPSGDTGLDAVVPVYAADNRLEGVLDTSLTLNGLGDFLQSLQVSKNGEIFIVDRSGLLVASSTITEPFIRVEDDIKRLSALESGDPVVQTATQSLEQQFGMLANITTAHPFYFDLAGERQFAQVTPYRDENGLDWLLVVVIPESDFMAYINASNRNTVLLIAASLLGAMLIATLMARWVTQPVLGLNQSAKALAQGDWTQRVATNRRDEVGQLAHSFNRMAEQLQASFASLQASEARYQSLFEDSPISLWEEDFSTLKRHLDNARGADAIDWRAYFEHHPEAVRRCAEKVKITDVNRATLEMFKAENKKELLVNPTRIFGEATYAMFRQELISLAEGRPAFEAEMVHQTLPGDEIDVKMRLNIIPGYEDTWSKVLVSMTDITERKQAEAILSRYADRLEVLHEIDRAILTAHSPQEIAQTALRHIRRLIPCRRAVLTLLDSETNEVETLTVEVESETQFKAGSRLPLEAYRPIIDELRQGRVFVHADPRGLPRGDILFAEGLRTGISVPLLAHEELIGAVSLWTDKSDPFSEEHVNIAREVADQLAIAIQQARLFEQVQEYAVELEQRVADRTRELAALYDVTSVASESLDLPTTLERSLDGVVGAMRSQAGAVHLLDESGQTLHLAARQGFSPDLVAQLETLSAGDSLPGWVIKRGDPLIVPDLAVEPRSVLGNRDDFHTYLGVPMRANGQTLGVLSVARAREQPQFNVEEVALLTTIADQVGVVVESARLRQLAEQSAVMAERERLARDLHDSVTQLLYSVNLFATVGREAYDLGDMDQVNGCLTELGQIAQQALKEMRLLVYELRPLALAQEGLVGALRQRLDAVERRAGVQAELQADAMLDLPRQVEEALYHIAQEALNNALKHAAASTITVRIGATGGQIELDVTDNGSGFDLSTAEGQGGLGLISMRERVEKMHGTLTVLSTPGGGTRVSVRLEV